MLEDYHNTYGKDPVEAFINDDNFVSVTSESITVHDGIDSYRWSISEAVPEDKEAVEARVFNLVILDYGMDRMPSNKVWVLSFLTAIPTAQEAESAARSAVKEFLDSEAGRKANDYANGYYNWGDVLTTVPRGCFEAHGLSPLGAVAMNALVSHDEILSDEDDE